jgi:hypothetical protein
LTPAEIRAISAYIKRASRGLHHLLVLVDVAGLRGISPETRRAAIAEPSLAPYRGIAVYNASFQARIVMKLLGLALNLVNRITDNPLAFFATEAEARRWIEERRRTIAREEPAG